MEEKGGKQSRGRGGRCVCVYREGGKGKKETLRRDIGRRKAAAGRTGEKGK